MESVWAGIVFAFLWLYFLGLHVCLCLFVLASETDLSFLFVRRLYFLFFLSFLQEFGKRILRGAAFLLETVCFDCK